MKHISKYTEFVNESDEYSKLTQEQRDFVEKYVQGKWHINSDDEK